MKMKYKIEKLRDNIFYNMDYLSTEYHLINDIFLELNRMIHWEMSHSMMFHWWVENEESINIINELIEKTEKK